MYEVIIVILVPVDCIQNNTNLKYLRILLSLSVYKFKLSNLLISLLLLVHNLHEYFLPICQIESRKISDFKHISQIRV